MSSKSWYALKVKGAPSRYKLSKNIQILLQCLDDYYSGSIDATELGRLVRLSPKRRTSIANTIAKCAEIIKKEPDEVRTCVDIIEMCTEVLEIADKKPPIEVFPFMKLPMEIRDRILRLMINTVFRTDTVVPASNMSLGTCRCAILMRGTAFQTAPMKTLPTLLGTVLKPEFCRIFFREKTFRFRCTCELLVHLTGRKGSTRSTFAENVRHISVHWCGKDSAKAFKLLASCRQLETLTLAVSKSTYNNLSERALLMRDFFPFAFRNVRITDALGLDELLELRGLKDVQVVNLHKAMPSVAIEMDRAGASRLLWSKLTQPNEEHDADDA
ncbi:hypothetical protein CDD81_6363 [Ophiocordyceps australis]|uniref:Uncharacterized protein n=1 Tax=Ophiocordyceps australis TaxID=1399860 RepID=A0A2C5Y708_9HYPO|nr:hypothetical protein CDD81_6363 [Ophiocordyceps australis]